MTYIVCAECGLAFPARPLQRPDSARSRDWPSALLAGPTGMASSRSGPSVPAAGPAGRSRGPQAPAPPGLERGVARYARTWVNVRDDRAQTAPSVMVLNPGERVMVDSLRDGWYRVLAAGRPLGYVHRSNLDTDRPTTRP